VTQDMLGMFKELSPRFLKVYLDLTQIIVTALTQFRTEVEQGKFPGQSTVIPSRMKNWLSCWPICEKKQSKKQKEKEALTYG